MFSKVDAFTESDKEVILGCAKENGAITAADTEHPEYPVQAKDYSYVWVRDASYACLAAKYLGLDVAEGFFRWVMKAQGWKKTGLFYEKYYVDGGKALRHFQPDQTGTLLLALTECVDEPCEFGDLLRGCAAGICRVWDKTHFKLVSQDLWEERLCFPDHSEAHTYSVAACMSGLRNACEIVADSVWQDTSDEMQALLDESFDAHFHRSFGEFADERVDASLLGLIYPTKAVPAKDPRMRKTLKLIEERIGKDYKMMRYEGDEYDGWVYEGVDRRKGAGYWPLLNYWMSICQKEKGRDKEALKYYEQVAEDVKCAYLPEQVFGNSIQQSPTPLCWSHAMHAIATEKLDLK